MPQAKTQAYLQRIVTDDADHIRFRLMDKYVPGWVEAAMAVRQTFFPAPEDEEKAGLAIPRKYRELIMIALQLGTQTGGGQGRGRFPGVGHTRTAVKEGATPKEIAEVVAITAYLCGQPALVDYGAACILAAEDAYERMQEASGAAADRDRPAG